MPKVSLDSPKAGGVSGSSKQGGIFGFTSASHDAGDDGGKGVNCVVDFEALIRVAKGSTRRRQIVRGNERGTRHQRGREKSCCSNKILWSGLSCLLRRIGRVLWERLAEMRVRWR